jgi:hypothetical protein
MDARKAAPVQAVENLKIDPGMTAKMTERREGGRRKKYAK